MNFSISNKEASNFARYSEDFNKIHTDRLTGYNSIYGENIAHGVLIIINFLKKTKIKNLDSLKFTFLSHISLNQKINIDKINENFYKICQSKKICLLVEISNLFPKIKFINFKKKNYLNYLKKKKIN
jgi:hypothetical protein